MGRENSDSRFAILTTKTTKNTEGEDLAQLLRYMTFAADTLGLLINFNSTPLNNGIK